MKKRLGLIINPVAGLGGAVALKGSDGPDIQQRALALGAVKKAGARAALALEALRPFSGDLTVYAGAGEMGSDLARSLGFEIKPVPGLSEARASGNTTPGDTRAAARALAAMPVDLLLFAGGDGTARDVCACVPRGFPVVGVPAGVKIHSAVYAASPAAAGKAALAVLTSGAPLHEAEVMDIDEQEYRAGRLRAQFYGCLTVPSLRGVMQNPKAASHHREHDIGGICHEIAERIARDDPGACYLFGAGSTVSRIMRHLGLEDSLLGVDVVKGGEVLARDATEADLLRIAGRCPCRLIVTVIGGQGHILGRGNQQLSPAVIRGIGLDHLWIVAAASKIFALADQRLFVDSGDEDLDRALRGYRKIIVGYQETLVCQVM